MERKSSLLQVQALVCSSTRTSSNNKREPAALAMEQFSLTRLWGNSTGPC
jgi:hypothetical protein